MPDRYAGIDEYAPYPKDDKEKKTPQPVVRVKPELLPAQPDRKKSLPVTRRVESDEFLRFGSTAEPDVPAPVTSPPKSPPKQEIEKPPVEVQLGDLFEEEELDILKQMKERKQKPIFVDPEPNDLVFELEPPEPESEPEPDSEPEEIVQVPTKKETPGVGKILKDVLTTRSAPTEPEQEEEKPKKMSFVERKFAAKPEKPAPTRPVVSEEPKTDEKQLGNLRSKPLPPVYMAPKKRSFLSVFGKLKPVAAIKEKRKSVRRTKETGFTPRQRIKRYNHIHEGGYGMAELDDEKVGVAANGQGNTSAKD